MKKVFKATSIGTKYLLSLILLSVSWFLVNFLWLGQKNAEFGISAIDDTFIPLLINSSVVSILSLLLSWDLLSEERTVHKFWGVVFGLLGIFLLYIKFTMFGILPWVLWF